MAGDQHGCPGGFRHGGDQAAHFLNAGRVQTVGGSVSYTHLDVYKRQPAHGAVPPACRIENLENAIGKGGLEMNRAFEKELDVYKRQAFGQQMRWITYERRSFAKKEKDAAGGRDHQIVLYLSLIHISGLRP